MSDFCGKRVLVLEDEPLIAMLLEDILVDLDCVVVGPVLDVGSAEALARDMTLDAAILDVNIGNRTSHSVAAILRERCVPFVVASGYDDADLVPGAGGALNKPYRPENVKAALARILERSDALDR
ncbi:MAG: response regulator [Sphingomonas sp.]|uniref:response regulator n=1 Tax=Sphingomonas sp. TaxID=28214 RepID=UPI001B16AA15|nr:response regulator [Sphingomonas sp.]MBO9621651.1 response regulator [Sphingomonas sp.]